MLTIPLWFLALLARGQFAATQVSTTVPGGMSVVKGLSVILIS